MKTLIASWINVIDIVHQFFDYETGNFVNTTKTKLISAIKKEEQILRSKLRPFYGDSLSLSSHINTVVLLTNQDLNFSFRDSSIQINSPGTQTYRIEFTSSTAFSVKPDVDVPQSGTTSSDLALTDITILTSAWTGYSFQAGDIIFLTTYYHEELLIDMVSKLAAARMIEEVFTAEAPNISVNATQLRSQVQELFERIINEASGDLLSIKKLSRDLDYISIDYNINKYGTDISNYLSED